MVQFLSPSVGEVPVGAGPPPSSGLLTLRELAALQQAPRRQPGTEVSVYAKPIPDLFGWKDHMFLGFDDGKNPLIARGQPSGQGLGDFVGGLLDGSLRVTAGVAPAAQSKDYGGSPRLIARTFLPNVSADEAAAGARAHAAGVNHGASPYGWADNSNSYAADVAEPIFGYRPGDDRTPGYRTRLQDGGSAPPPYDLSPLLNTTRAY